MSGYRIAIFVQSAWDGRTTFNTDRLKLPQRWGRVTLLDPKRRSVNPLFAGSRCKSELERGDRSFSLLTVRESLRDGGARVGVRATLPLNVSFLHRFDKAVITLMGHT